MNTLTHALVGVAVFGRPRLTLSLLCATLAGAAFPDISILVMVAWEVGVNGLGESELWNHAYFREPWVTYSAMSNSFFVFGGVALIAWWRSWPWLLAFPGTAVLHFIGDIFLHHDDGHAHFWPLSNCVFYSPISYWDPNHFGLWWTVFEMMGALGLAVLIWRQTSGWTARIYAILLTALFWMMSIAFFVFMTIGDGMGGGPESSGHGKFVRPACPGSVDVARQHVQIAE